MNHKECFAQIESNYLLIRSARQELADLKKEKAVKRTNAWLEANGTAKEKEDFVKAAVADLDKEIKYKEANIEYMYNMVDLLTSKMVYIDE